MNNHYEGELIRVEKFDPAKVYAAVYYDAESQKFYLKRFKFELNNNPSNLFISEEEGSYLVAITSAAGSQVVIQFGGKHEGRQNEAVAVDSFIAEKGWKAKGKRLTQYETEKVVLIEPPVLEDEDEDFDFEETTSEPQEDTPSDIPEDTDFPEEDSQEDSWEGEDEPTLF